MKQLTLLLFALCLFLTSVRAQTNNVGIGTTTPAASALLDVSSTTKGLLAPRMTQTQRDAIATPVATGLLIYQTDNTPGFYTYNGTAWTALSSGASQLEKITQNSKTGHRIFGRNAANYGNIGTDALDLSLSTSASTTKGATGQYSVAMGESTTASGDYSTATGRSTTASGAFSTAMGYGAVASEYASTAMGSGQASGSSSTAMGNGAVASGSGATAMGINSTASGRGATAMGNSVTASGETSVAMGQSSTASGDYSTVIGVVNTASGYGSMATGIATTAKSYTEFTVGTNNTSYTPASATAFNAADRAFGVGIGTGSAALKDGLIVYKDGTLYVNKLTAAPTTTTDRIYNVSNVLYINGTVVGTQTSDARYKERVEDLPSALATIQKLRPVSYYWKDQKWGAQKEIGFIAQELKAKYPEVVVTDTDGYHKVNYGVLTAVLTKGMQEQQSQIEALGAKNAQLEKENAALKAQLSGVADRLGSIEKALNGGAKTIVNNAEASVKK